jgi:hypothetical protein
LTSLHDAQKISPVKRQGKTNQIVTQKLTAISAMMTSHQGGKLVVTSRTPLAQTCFLCLSNRFEHMTIVSQLSGTHEGARRIAETKQTVESCFSVSSLCLPWRRMVAERTKRG